MPLLLEGCDSKVLGNFSSKKEGRRRIRF